MRLETYIKSCLKNKEFREEWQRLIEKDGGLSFSDTILALDDIYNDTFNEAKLSKDEQQKIIDNLGIYDVGSGEKVVEFFQNTKGCPLAEFLDDMDNQKLKAKTLENISRLSKVAARYEGNLIKHVDQGIYELRTKQGSNITRIFYFFAYENALILTNGYIKESQKLDKLEFEKAKKYRQEYSNRAFKEHSSKFKKTE